MKSHAKNHLSSGGRYPVLRAFAILSMILAVVALISGLVAAGWALVVSGAASATETVTYTYDARGRLVQVTRTGGPSGGTQVTYTHDKANNRTRVLVTGAPH